MSIFSCLFPATLLFSWLVFLFSTEWWSCLSQEIFQSVQMVLGDSVPCGPRSCLCWGCRLPGHALPSGGWSLGQALPMGWLGTCLLWASWEPPDTVWLTSVFGYTLLRFRFCCIRACLCLNRFGNLIWEVASRGDSHQGPRWGVSVWWAWMVLRPTSCGSATCEQQEALWAFLGAPQLAGVQALS